MSTATARSLRLLHDRRLPALWRQPALDIALQPSDEAPGRAPRRLQLSFVQGVLELAVDLPDGGTWSMLDAPAGAPQELLDFTLEALLAPVLEALQWIGLDDSTCRLLDACPAPPSPRAWSVLRCGGERVATIQVLRMDDGVHDTVQRALSRVSSPFPADLGALPCRGMVALSERQVRRTTLARLQVGDVLLLQRPMAADEESPCRVRFGLPGHPLWCASALVDESDATLSGEPCMIDDSLEQDADALGDAEPMESLSDLEVPVRFEVSTTTIRLGELAALGTGSVLALSAPLSGAQLRLVCCGRVIGHADLVAVDDKLGARITRLAVDDEPVH
jgi:type III secretion protein Q